MRRFLIFGVLGPALGFLPFGIPFLMGMLASPSLDNLVGGLHAYLLLQLVAYAFGIVPALAAAICDWRIPAPITGRRRLLLVGSCGYILSYLTFAVALTYHQDMEPRGNPVQLISLFYGFIGAVSAIACSWLTNETDLWRRRGPQSEA